MPRYKFGDGRSQNLQLNALVLVSSAFCSNIFRLLKMMNRRNDIETVIIGGNKKRANTLNAEEEAKLSIKLNKELEVETRFSAAQNKKFNTANQSQHIRKVDELTEAGKIITTDRNTAEMIKNARVAMGWTQQNLANECNLQLSVIKGIENMTEKYNGQNISKIKRVLKLTKHPEKNDSKTTKQNQPSGKARQRQ
ncbi:hypothetical protein GJ496_005634 [Pomphorhynchus laevis]|nr:hypothetical protein GJ496_005634 [Pomphorhynchus laevis]